MNQPRLFTRWRKQLAAATPDATARRPAAAQHAACYRTRRPESLVPARIDRSTTFPEECTVTSTSLPDSLIATLPGSSYTDPGIFAQEQERIFEAMWFCAARASDLAKPGAFRTVDVGRESILVTRARDNSIRAYFNVCRHRGAKLCTEESGEVKRAFQCPYHAWTYDLNGKLVAAPNLTKMPDVGRTEYGLASVAVREWLGYVWVCLAEDPPSFEESRRRGRRAARRRRVDRALRHRQPRGRQADRLRRQGELEAHHRELHGVLPLRDDPPRTHRGAARVRRRLRGPVLRRATAPSSVRRSRASPSTAPRGWTASPESPRTRTAATTRSPSGRRSSSTSCPTM